MRTPRGTRQGMIGTCILASTLVLTGCGATKHVATSGTLASGATTSMAMGSASPRHTSGTDTGSMAGMPGMAATTGGAAMLPSKLIGLTTWQGMDIEARLSQGVPFEVFAGSGEKPQMVKPAAKNGAHLMVMLQDHTTHVAIPYASVWATIVDSHGTTVFDERQWAMLSQSMGPHYGNDITLPAAGDYTLKLLVSPPVVARHMEYANVWQTSHTVTFHFHWTPASTAG